jgi:hypothetical protein
LDLADESLSDVAERLNGTRVAIFACPDTDSFSARFQNRKEHTTIAIHTTVFLSFVFMLFAGLALCYGEIQFLT